MKFLCLLALAVSGMSTICLGQTYLTDKDCQMALIEAETTRNEQIYTDCGFNEERRAMIRWSSWAQRNNAYQAMYELCVRFPESVEATSLCQKAALAGNGSALLHQGNQLYTAQKYIEALQSYTQALKSPMLTDHEKGEIGEKIGVLYIDPNSTYYNPQKGLPLLEQATIQRGALANNIMGVYSLLGLEGQPINQEKAFEYFWRAILLGCPNAEENLGILHLLNQKTITPETAKSVMQDKIFTCKFEKEMAQGTKNSLINVTNCDCNKILERESLAKQYEYRLISIEGDLGILQDTTGQRFSARIGTQLPNGAQVTEIRKTAVIVLAGKQRHVLNLAPVDNCVQICQEKKSISNTNKSKLPKIKPYHLTFTPKECSTLLYYAEKLVDTKLPFTGKKECGFSSELNTATDLLLGK